MNKEHPSVTQAFFVRCRLVPKLETPQSRKRAFTRNTSHGGNKETGKGLVNGWKYLMVSNG